MAGDVNGDGYADVLIGAPFDDEAGTDAGAAYLVLGGPDGWGTDIRLGSGGIKYTSSASGDFTGISVAGAGDVNNDGFDDFLVGSQGFDFLTLLNLGGVYLVLGSASPSGNSLSSAFQYNGQAAGDQAGFSVAGVGDVDGDGDADFVVGARFNGAGGTGAGRAYLIRGSASPTGGNLSSGRIYTGENAVDNAGYAVAGAGDVNGDGFSDFLIGAPGQDGGGTSAGAAYLVFGSALPSSADLSTVIRYDGEANSDLAGVSVAGAGDVNGDNYADFLVGASGNNFAGVNNGAAYLVLGGAGASGGSLAAAIRYTGKAAQDELGVSVAGGQDVNGGGLADLLIGAPLADIYSTFNAGATYLIFSDGLSPDRPAYRQRQRVGANAVLSPILFKQAGVQVTLGSNFFFGDVTVTRHLFHPCNVNKRLALPIWTIDSRKPASNFNLRFKYTDAQISGMTESNLQVYGRPAGEPCAAWTQIGIATVDPTRNFVTISASPGNFGQFTLADSLPSPTAVNMESVGLSSAELPTWQVNLIALLLFGTIGYLIARRRSQNRNLVSVSPTSMTVAERLHQLANRIEPF